MDTFSRIFAPPPPVWTLGRTPPKVSTWFMNSPISHARSLFYHIYYFIYFIIILHFFKQAICIKFSTSGGWSSQNSLGDNIKGLVSRRRWRFFLKWHILAFFMREILQNLFCKVMIKNLCCKVLYGLWSPCHVISHFACSTFIFV